MIWAHNKVCGNVRFAVRRQQSLRETAKSGVRRTIFNKIAIELLFR